MDESLLANDLAVDLEEENATGFYEILQRKEHQMIRLIFILLAQFLFFILGAGFYVFPLWLNFIVTDHVDLSREALTSLGAVPFIGLLGVAGAVIIFVNWIKFGNKTTKFLSLTLFSALSVILSWSLLYWVVVETPKDINNSNFVMVFFILLLMGTAVGILFTIFLDKVFPLIKVKHHFVYSACCNMIFALGSIFSLSAKLLMNTQIWMNVMLVVESVTVIIVFLFVYRYVHEITVHADHTVVTEVSTKKLLLELLKWKRQENTDNLLQKDCQVRSSQFYWLLLSFTAVCTLATCFMANLGELICVGDVRAQFGCSMCVMIFLSGR